jgi:hypothetical protein
LTNSNPLGCGQKDFKNDVLNDVTCPSVTLVARILNKVKVKLKLKIVESLTAAEQLWKSSKSVTCG